MEAVKQKLKKSKPSISIKVILTLLKLILTLNSLSPGIQVSIISRKKVALWALNVRLAMQILLWVGCGKAYISTSDKL